MQIYSAEPFKTERTHTSFLEHERVNDSWKVGSSLYLVSLLYATICKINEIFWVTIGNKKARRKQLTCEKNMVWYFEA